MNPPFSASPGVERIRHHVDLHHIRSAFSMLPPGGRLVAISSAHCVPGDAAWVDAFASLDPPAQVAFTAPIDGRAYARRGTTFDTRLTVLDRGGEKHAQVYAGHPVRDAGHLLQAVTGTVPARRPIEPVPGADLFGQAPAPQPRAGQAHEDNRADTASTDVRLGPGRRARIRGGAGRRRFRSGPRNPPAPTRDGGHRASTCRARSSTRRRWCSRAPWRRCRTPCRPTARCCPRCVVTQGLLSDAQLESVVLAGQAHERHLAAEYRIGAGWETVRRVDAEAAMTATMPTRQLPKTTARPSTPTSRCPIRCASGAAGCWATAPAAAREGRSPPSSSTSGSGAASERSGSPSPTSCWRTRAATGAPSAGVRKT